MKLKFVGPKAIISHTGITFDTNKEDKYVFINIVIQLLNALDHEYIPDKKYLYNPGNLRLNNDELWERLSHYCPDLKERCTETQKNATCYVDEQIEHAKENQILGAEEKEVLVKNYTLMRDYIIQRAINKNLYYCVVNALAEVMKRGHIDYVVAPMFQKFAHVFHSVEGVLKKGRFPIDTNIEIYEEKGELLVKLDLIHR
jgi:hypothetical protein